MSQKSASVTINGVDLTPSQVTFLRIAMSNYRDALPTGKKEQALAKLARKESTAILQLLGAEQ